MQATEYKKTLDMDEIIYKTAKEFDIPEESLSREYKDAKELYVKPMQNIDVHNVVIRSW